MRMDRCESSRDPKKGKKKDSSANKRDGGTSRNASENKVMCDEDRAQWIGRGILVHHVGSFFNPDGTHKQVEPHEIKMKRTEEG